MKQLSSQYKKISFNKINLSGSGLYYIKRAALNNKISGDGEFTEKYGRFIEDKFKTKEALLTTSCYTALDIAAILAGIRKDDEVILPSSSFHKSKNIHCG